MAKRSHVPLGSSQQMWSQTALQRTGVQAPNEQAMEKLPQSKRDSKGEPILLKSTPDNNQHRTDQSMELSMNRRSEERVS